MTIVVIDYGMGNLRSVVNAFSSVGADVEIARSPHDLVSCRGIVLPGVGAFRDGMVRLTDNGWIDALEVEVMDRKKPFLGLCLGMQLMGSRGTEHGAAEGLGWIPGDVLRLREADRSLRIPHIGWNDVSSKVDSRLFRELSDGVFYFLHSYHLRPEHEGATAATCQYGDEFVAAVESENLFGAQFHPEKSQKDGLKILQNFASVTAG